MQPIYVELGDEVTTIIERIAGSEEGRLALVVPKGAIVLQSIVNLKLIRKAAADHGKDLVLVTTDKIGRNLAEQIGLNAYSKFDPQHMEGVTEDENQPASDEPKVIAGVKIHRYYDDEGNETEEEQQPIEPIIPKSMLKEEGPASALGPADKAVTEPGMEPEAYVPGIQTDEAPAESLTEEDPAHPAVEAAPLKRVEAMPRQNKEGAEDDSEPTITRTSVKAVEKGANPHMAKIRRRSRISYAIFLLCLLLVAGTGLAFTFYPKSTLTITVPAEKWEKNLSIVTKPVGQTTATNEVAVEALAADLTDNLSAKATGTKDIGEKAAGNASLSNKLGVAVTIPAATRLLASGQYFTTTDKATVPGATAKVNPDGSLTLIPGTATVAIAAEASGAAGNLSNVPASIVSTDFAGADARIVSTTGGTSKQVSIVTQNDILTARNNLTKQLQDKLQQQLVEKSKGRDLIYNANADSFQFDSFTSSAQADTQADTVQVSAKGSIKRLVIDRDAVKKAANAQLHQDDTDDKVLFLQTVNIATVAITGDKDGALDVTASGTVRPVISSEKIQAKLAGHSSAEAITIAKEAAANAQGKVTFTPSWWPRQRFPISTKYVSVKVEYE